MPSCLVVLHRQSAFVKIVFVYIYFIVYSHLICSVRALISSKGREYENIFVYPSALSNMKISGVLANVVFICF